MARFVLFGASGFIGAHVVGELVRVQTPADTPANVAAVGRSAPPSGVHWIRRDAVALSPSDLAEVLERLLPDVIINCAGSTEGSLSELVKVNVGFVATLIEAVAVAAPAARLVHLGSAAEYGDAEPGTPVQEGQPARPTSAYGVTKLAGTQLLVQARAEGRVDAVVLRAFNPVGAGLRQTHVLGRAAANIQRALAADAPHFEMGSLEAYRDFIDVRDVARAVLLAADRPLAGDAVLNIGRGEAVQVRKLVQDLARLAGFRGTVLEKAFGSPRSRTVHWQQADIDRTVQALQWTPEFDLTSSLGAVWQASTAPAPA